MRPLSCSLAGVLGLLSCTFARPLTSDAGSSDVTNSILIRFSIPCSDCSVVAGQDLDFELSIPASGSECTNISPSLNGIALYNVGHGVSDGVTSLNASRTDGDGLVEISASWQSRCLRDQASLIAVDFDLVGKSSSLFGPYAGFAVSFKQSPLPKIIRVERHPVPNIGNDEMVDFWLHTSERPQFTTLREAQPLLPTLLSGLHREYEVLEQLKNEIHQLHHGINVQEGKILSLLKDEFNVCEGLICYIQTAIRKTPDFLYFLQNHFRKGPSKSGDSTHKQTHPKVVHAELSKDRPTLCLDHPDRCDIPPPSPPPPPHHHLPTPLPSADTPVTASEYDEFKPPHREGDQPPPFDDHRHDHHHRPPWVDDKEGMHHWSEDKPHHRPHIQPPAPRHRHFRLIFAIAGFLITASIVGVLIKLLKIYLSNPRVQADRAARAEECSTRRAFRRAACRHRFKQMFTGFRRRRSNGSGDYEEKRQAMSRSGRQRTDSDSIVRSDITSLRRAHDIVAALMRAEEGRVQHSRDGEPTIHVAELPANDSSANSVSTLPIYAAPPPRYSQELSRDMEVVDGFRYTPTASEATPEGSLSNCMFNDDDMTTSSVVDCRSRMSFDTETAQRSKKSLELAGDRMRFDF